MRAWGIASLVFSSLTLLNWLLCPTVVVGGQTSVTQWVQVGPNERHQRDYEFTDPIAFCAVELVFATAVIGCCLLRREFVKFAGKMSHLSLFEKDVPAVQTPAVPEPPPAARGSIATP